MAAGSVTSGGGMLTGWTAGACIAGASSFSGAWVGGTQGFKSTVGPYPRGGVELEEARFGPLSKTMSSAMLAAIWLIVPLNVVMSPSNVTMRAPSVVVDGARVSGDGLGGGTTPKCAGGAPAGVGGRRRSAQFRPAERALGRQAGPGVRDLGRTRGDWVARAGTGPQKGALGREKGRLGLTGPRVWIRLFRDDFQVRPNGSGEKLGRVVSDGLNWAERAGPAQTEGKWAEPVREKMNGEDEYGRRGGFRRLRTAVPASGCRGDGGRGRGRRQRAPPWLRRARDGRNGSRDSLSREDFLNFPARFPDFSAKDF
ncbi:hypothetical protein CRG98_032623 [Punica granatum]|uniref:Uncharacterized protein n=1 Tax=Punica granatum TaxID=22663 RepID=A0A2I0ISL6_PUNGR|nr:hypothetical protein CRG98_032623 [Punica granatum]